MLTDRKIDSTASVLRKPRLSPRLRDGVLTPPVVTANADPTKFNVSAFSYVLNGKVYKTAAQAALTFSAVHATGIAAWLGIGLYIDARGTIITRANPNTGDQDYATEALALASIPGSTATELLFATITLLTGSADWDANTDSLSAADLVSSNLLGFFSDRRWDIVKPGVNAQIVEFQTFNRAVAGTLQAELALPKQTSDQILTNPNLEVDRRTVLNASVTKLRFSGFDYVIDGVLYHTDAQKQLAFTAAHLVALDKWGAILLLIDTLGAYSTLVGEATQTTAMAYNNAAAARAALPAVPAGKIAVGILVIEADGSTWTANTDDIVAGSDLEGFDLVPALPDRMLDAVTLSITVAEPEDFSLTAFDAVFDGVKVTKALTANLDFTANHVATASKYLAILVGMTVAGTISTKVPIVSGRSQTAAQGYDTLDEAVAALPTPSAGVLPIGYIWVLADSGGWTANTDDLTPGSDLTNSGLVGFTTTQMLEFTARSNIPKTTRNGIWPVSGGAFVANVPTNATLEGDILALRAWEHSATILLVAAKTDAVVDTPLVTVTTRPYPAANE